MTIQDYINIAMAVGGGAFTLIMKWVHSHLDKLTKHIDELKLKQEHHQDKITSIELLIAGDYAKKADVDKMEQAIMLKLDKVLDKLDRKADK